MIYGNNPLLIDCNQTANGVLTKGLRAAIVALEETTENLFNQYDSTINTYQNKYNMFNDEDLISACKN